MYICPECYYKQSSVIDRTVDITAEFDEVCEVCKRAFDVVFHVPDSAFKVVELLRERAKLI